MLGVFLQPENFIFWGLKSRSKIQNNKTCLDSRQMKLLLVLFPPPVSGGTLLVPRHCWASRLHPPETGSLDLLQCLWFLQTHSGTSALIQSLCHCAQFTIAEQRRLIICNKSELRLNIFSTLYIISGPECVFAAKTWHMREKAWIEWMWKMILYQQVEAGQRVRSTKELRPVPALCFTRNLD